MPDICGYKTSRLMDIQTVRYWAAAYGYTEVQHNQQSRVLGFKRGDERVNVYYTTGTPCCLLICDLKKHLS